MRPSDPSFIYASIKDYTLRVPKWNTDSLLLWQIIITWNGKTKMFSMFHLCFSITPYGCCCPSIKYLLRFNNAVLAVLTINQRVRMINIRK